MKHFKNRLARTNRVRVRTRSVRRTERVRELSVPTSGRPAVCGVRRTG